MNFNAKVFDITEDLLCKVVSESCYALVLDLFKPGRRIQVGRIVERSWMHEDCPVTVLRKDRDGKE